MGSYQAFELENLQADRSRSNAEFLRRPGLSMGIYHLPVGEPTPGVRRTGSTAVVTSYPSR
jgi:hypothetical protein